MPRGGARHEVDGAVGQGQRLGGGPDNRHARGGGPQPAQQPVTGVEGDDPGAPGGQLPGRDAGSGGQIQHAPAGEASDHLLDRAVEVVGIVRAHLVVEVGHLVEDAARAAHAEDEERPARSTSPGAAKCSRV